MLLTSDNGTKEWMPQKQTELRSLGKPIDKDSLRMNQKHKGFSLKSSITVRIILQALPDPQDLRLLLQNKKRFIK